MLSHIMTQGSSLCYGYIKRNTVEPPNSHTYPNSHTLFGLTKMWLFGYFKDFKRKISLNCFSRWANQLLFLINCLIQDWIWGFWAIFAPQIREWILWYDPDFSKCCHFLSTQIVTHTRKVSPFLVLNCDNFETIQYN